MRMIMIKPLFILFFVQNFYANLHDMLVLAVRSCTKDDLKCLEALRNVRTTVTVLRNPVTPHITF